MISANIKTFDEAKKYLDVNVLEPDYLPQGFKIKRIQGVSNDNKKIRNVWIEYFSQDKTFVISVEKNTELKSFEGYKDVVINGTTGHAKSFGDNSNESVELRWIVDKNMYTIEGTISESLALKVARSLK